MCFPLYGHELTEETSPIEAGLDVFVAFEKPAFQGREVMADQKKRGVRRRLVAFRMAEKGAPPVRPPLRVFAQGGMACHWGRPPAGR